MCDYHSPVMPSPRSMSTIVGTTIGRPPIRLPLEGKVASADPPARRMTDEVSSI